LEDCQVWKFLDVSCSSRGQDSESYRLAEKIIFNLVALEPAAMLVKRMVGTDGMLRRIDRNYAQAQHSADANVFSQCSIAKSEELIAELQRSDVLVIGTPMHNLGAPSSLKACIDHVVWARRTFNLTKDGKVGLLHDRPVYVAVSSGGMFSGEHARQTDFLTALSKDDFEYHWPT
jgi:FMN-dependent NADH-azoreductase